MKKENVVAQYMLYFKTNVQCKAVQKECTIYIQFQLWAIPRGNAIRGRPVEGVKQASTSPPVLKNTFNLIAIRWIASQRLN